MTTLEQHSFYSHREQGSSSRTIHLADSTGKEQTLSTCLLLEVQLHLSDFPFKEMQCSAHPQTLKEGKGATTHMFLMRDCFPSMQLMGTPHTSGTQGHYYGAQQFSHTFNFCMTDLYTPVHSLNAL